MEGEILPPDEMVIVIVTSHGHPRTMTPDHGPDSFGVGRESFPSVEMVIVIVTSHGHTIHGQMISWSYIFRRDKNIDNFSIGNGKY